MDRPHICAFTAATGEPVARLVLAHGAGAGMDSDFMADTAEKLGNQGVEVYRFNFPYMQQMSESGKRKPPNRMPLLLQAFAEQLALQDTHLPLFIGGKSMGGRASTILAAESDFRDTVKDKVKGAIALGYPFHPAGKPDKLRIEHLPEMVCPCLVVQGERDTMGNKDEIAQYALPESLSLAYLPDGDHSFKPRKASGYTLAQNLDSAVAHIVTFIRQHL